jgi:putative acetyltransferase
MLSPYKFRRLEKAMRIRRSTAEDRPQLIDIWLRSVRATHNFLTESDIAALLPLTRQYLASDAAELWTLCNEEGKPIGFMGLAESAIDTLFIDPHYHRLGGGCEMIEHARGLKVELTVDVNEQNVAARQFYEACGFVTEGRSDLDSTGRPFQLLHMRSIAA